MPSSEDVGTPRSSFWSLEEFSDLVAAWEYAQSKPRGSGSESLHDVVYRRFVALQGGSTRRNKAALVSKRSALKFSYIFLRDFDQQQKQQNQPSFFELSPNRRADVMKGWKQINSSVVEITPAMFQGLGRIVNKGGATAAGDEDSTAKRRQDPPVTRETSRPSRSGSKALGKRKQASSSSSSARAISNPWSSEEMLLLVTSWGNAAKLLCESESPEPMSIVHEMYRQFEKLQGGKPTRNLSGMATRRRVLRQSYFRIHEFNKIQEMNGEPPFSELPAEARQYAMRAWKNSNLIDLPKDLYDTLADVIPLDSRAVALEDQRRAKAGTSKISNAVTGHRRKVGRPPKKPKLLREGVDEEGSVSDSSKPSIEEDSEEEKPSILSATGQSRNEGNAIKSSVSPITAPIAPEPSASESLNQAKAAQQILHKDVFAAQTTPQVVANSEQDEDKTLSVTANEFHDSEKTVATQGLGGDKAPTDQDIRENKPIAVEDGYNGPVTSTKRSSKAKKQRKVMIDGPNGKAWGDDELDILVKAWEKAAKFMSENYAPGMSLNREMYRDFVEMQGGSSVRNSTSLAARRSSLKFSYAHIFSFNEAQKLKGEPSYHDIPQDTRMSVLRSWKNRNSVDLSKEMYDTLGRIIALDKKISQARALHRPSENPAAKDPANIKDGKDVKISKDSKPPSDQQHSNKTAKWTTEESADLIKACADVMNVPTDQEQTAAEREALIYDRFVARRQNAGDTDTPVRRDLRAMAQQWRYILASYTYIKACNDKAAEMNSSSWFDMPPAQKRAYQQCTNVPLKFVDLDADMFALVTETSFDGLVSPPLPSPAAKSASDGISLRPRETLKRTKDAYMTSDSESEVSLKAKVKSTRAKRSEKDPLVKKGNSWPSKEVWNLVNAWEAGTGVSNNSRLSTSVEAVYEQFTKLQEGNSDRHRSIHSVRNKMIALKSSYLGVSKFIAEHQCDSSVWFDMTFDERFEEIRTWKNKTVMDLNKELYEALGRVIPNEDDTPSPNDIDDKRKAGRSKRSSPSRPATKHHDEKRHASGSKTEKPVADWNEEELLKLAEALGELLEGRRTRRYLFEEEKDRFYRRYEELGGSNPVGVAISRARYLMDSYEFIYAYNERAEATNSLSWFELSPADRGTIAKKVSRLHRNFNGLGTVDAELFDAVDEVDAILRQKLNETKRKTYKPPTDAASGTSRYVDPEVVVQSCIYRKRGKQLSTKKSRRTVEVPIELQMFSSESSSSESSSSESSSTDGDSASDYRESTALARSRLVAQPTAHALRRTPSPRHPTNAASARAARRTRKRARDDDDSDDGSSTLYLTEIIQQQTRRLEEAVKRFRKDSAVARKEHHEFLLRKIQDSFPVDSGNGSYLERVAERQGQSLVDLFQRLQQQRDAEKAKDEELMRQLFGQTERA